MAGRKFKRPLRLDRILVPPENPNPNPNPGLDPVPGPGAASGEEFDFADVFGVLPPITETEIAVGTGLEVWMRDPAVICTRSHSLVGPCSTPQPRKAADPADATAIGGIIIDDDGGDSDTTTATATTTTTSSKDPGSPHLSHMGSEDSLQGLSLTTPKLGPLDFDLLRVVGQGAFGKVFLVQRKGTDEFYAMKVMRKDKIMEKNHGDYMKAERDILTKVVHPFIVQLCYSFQTKSKLYLILDFINGGHLFFQLYRQGIFSEDLARIYTAEIVSAVAHLHNNGIIHRDLKPENILVDAEGHVKLTDFGLAKEVEDAHPTNSMCGTMEYMAPEIVLGKGHGKAADWWSVGILLYEMLTGRPPFTHTNRHKLQQQITKEKIKLPSYLSSEVHLLLKGLLQKEEKRRMGYGLTGCDEIKKQKWFKAINWAKLEARQIQPKFRPEVNGKECTANFDEKWTKLPAQDSPASTPKDGDNNFFQGFSYVAPSSTWLS